MSDAMSERLRAWLGWFSRLVGGYFRHASDVQKIAVAAGVKNLGPSGFFMDRAVNRRSRSRSRP